MKLVKIIFILTLVSMGLNSIYAKSKTIDLVKEYIKSLQKVDDTEHKLYYINKLKDLKDTRAIEIIAYLLKHDKDKNVRMACLDFFYELASNLSIGPLLDASINDTDEEIRMTAATYQQYIEAALNSKSNLYGEAKRVIVKNPLKKISIPGGIIIGSSCLIIGFCSTYFPYSYINSKKNLLPDDTRILKQGYFNPLPYNIPVIIVVTIGAGGIGTAFGLNLPIIFGKKNKESEYAFNVYSRLLDSKEPSSVENVFQLGNSIKF